MFTHRGQSLRLLLVALCLSVLCSHVLAQEADEPIEIGQNTFGELTAELNTRLFSLTANGGETAIIQVLSLSPAFVPRFRVVNPTGVEILAISNPNGLASLTGSVSFTDAGAYLIEVRGENGTIGQFVLSLQPGAVLPEPVELTLDQPISDIVGGNSPVRIYHFSTTTEPLILTILSDASDTGMFITLYDEVAGKTIASNDTGVTAVAYRLPPENRLYRVEVHTSGLEDDLPFSICLGACGDEMLAGKTTPASDGVSIIETSEVVAATCTVASDTGGSINVRSAPGTQYAIIGSLPVGQSLQVLGQFIGGDWFQVSLSNGGAGWVSASVTRLEGDCSPLPLLAAPANAPLAPTPPPIPTLPPTPTQPTAGGAPSPTPTSAPDEAPGSEPSATATSAVLPDLTVTITRFTISAEGAAEIRYTVFNALGAAELPQLLVCVNGLDCVRFHVGALSSNQISEAIRLQVNYNSHLPAYTASVTIDPDDLVSESDEGNNVATKQCTPNTAGSITGTGPCE